MTYEVVHELDDEAVDDLHACYLTYEWWDDRDREDVRRAVDHTDVVVGLRDESSGELVAAGRVLTDFVYYGKIYDVIVTEELRGRGLGSELLEAIVSHPDLADVDVLTLDCREGLVEFYEDCGFERHDQFVPRADGEEGLVVMRYAADRTSEGER
ncbi:GNAT family N-acetyltransferase [Halopiger goleimassiliensis]|uniref:GNAT family N-acetyltransferase n=1 Tax=Halopiger goleimassiliensis TaxID=1293048 RepID=UPI0006781823|nr:GNAT family N-acetyltransferase [Halopiger goleimassiliensis]